MIFASFCKYFLNNLTKNKNNWNVWMQPENPCRHHVFWVSCWIQLQRNVEVEESFGRVYQVILLPPPNTLNAMPCKNKWIVYCVPCKSRDNPKAKVYGDVQLSRGERCIFLLWRICLRARIGKASSFPCIRHSHQEVHPWSLPSTFFLACCS